MTRWVSASELAGKPGMPKARAGVRHKAEREGWRSRQETGVGGMRNVYCPDDLPQETIRALALEDECSEAPPTPSVLRLTFEINIRIEGGL